METAHEYTSLSHHPESARSIFARIREEYERTTTQVLNIADTQGLLEENPALALSLRERTETLSL